jgi:predicted metal-dependent phosphoesterase TrpH
MSNNNRILFEHPDLESLNKKFTVFDLHFHTTYTDGFNGIDAIAEKVKELGIGIAITDHNDIRGAVEMDKIKEILSIPGIEVTSREGSHLLVYFYSIGSLKKFYSIDIRPFMGPEIMSSLSLEMEEIIQRARKYKSLVIFPHPFSATFTGICNSQVSKERLESLFSMADGVEVINAENLKKWNLKSALLGFNLNKAITAGSDGHTLYHMGKVVSYADCKKTRHAFLEAIRNKRNKVIGKEISLLRKVHSNGLKLRCNIRNYPDLMEKNIKYGYNVINMTSKRLKDNVTRKINETLKAAAAATGG